MKALLLVGLQNDFFAGGTLAVPGADSVVPIANELMGNFKLVVATQQWHPANHRSFHMNHVGRVVGERVKVGQLEQILKPIHCVQNTVGAELHPSLSLPRINKIVRLGLDAALDDESGFFDARRLHSTGLSDYLHEKKVRKLYVLGLATEQAVMMTALDSVGFGFKTWLVSDACRAFNPAPEMDMTKRALETMAAAGVGVLTSGELIADFRAKAKR